MADMRILFGAIVLFLIAGCLWTPISEEENKTVTTPGQPDVTVMNETTTPTQQETGNGQPETGSGQQVTEPTQDTKPTSVATSQADCSTLSPDCESCLAKKGCNWCKGTNACYYEGIVPTISSCSPNEWATTVPECKLVSDDKYCSEFTNCADCLSGSGCQWCIQGSVCAGESSSEKCFGGWMTESYQCNYASR